LLALGECLGLAWAVSPFLGAVTLILLFRIFELFLDRNGAWLGTLAIGLSPFFTFNAASFMSHTPALFWQAAATLSFLRSIQKEKPKMMLLAGLATGFCFLTRPLDGVLLATILGATVIISFRRTFLKPIAYLAVGMSIGIILFLCYTSIQIGHPFTLGHDIYRKYPKEIAWQFLFSFEKHLGRRIFPERQFYRYKKKEKWKLAELIPEDSL